MALTGLELWLSFLTEEWLRFSLVGSGRPYLWHLHFQYVAQHCAHLCVDPAYPGVSVAAQLLVLVMALPSVCSCWPRSCPGPAGHLFQTASVSCFPWVQLAAVGWWLLFPEGPCS